MCKAKENGQDIGTPVVGNTPPMDAFKDSVGVVCQGRCSEEKQAGCAVLRKLAEKIEKMNGQA